MCWGDIQGLPKSPPESFQRRPSPTLLLAALASLGRSGSVLSLQGCAPALPVQAALASLPRDCLQQRTRSSSGSSAQNKTGLGSPSLWPRLVVSLP